MDDCVFVTHQVLGNHQPPRLLLRFLSFSNQTWNRKKAFILAVQTKRRRPFAGSDLSGPPWSRWRSGPRCPRGSFPDPLRFSSPSSSSGTRPRRQTPARPGGTGPEWRRQEKTDVKTNKTPFFDIFTLNPGELLSFCCFQLLIWCVTMATGVSGCSGSSINVIWRVQEEEVAAAASSWESSSDKDGNCGEPLRVLMAEEPKSTGWWDGSLPKSLLLCGSLSLRRQFLLLSGQEFRSNPSCGSSALVRIFFWKSRKKTSHSDTPKGSEASETMGDRPFDAKREGPQPQWVERCYPSGLK